MRRSTVEHHLPPRVELHTTGQALKPYEATFRIPQSVTKTDARSCLAAVYGVQATYIRTDNCVAPLPRRAWAVVGHIIRTTVVGLVEPLYYLVMAEDISKADREAREQSLNKLQYFGRARKDMLEVQLFRMTRKN